MLTERDISAAMTTRRPAPVPAENPRPAGEDAGASDDLLSSVQRTQIDRVLKRVGGNKTRAARLLGISRRSLYRWIDRLENIETHPKAKAHPKAEAHPRGQED
jgi:transcriptional regulator with PAS, ATPase and Fis domain